MRFKQYVMKPAGGILAIGILFSACSKNSSRTTGTNYNDEKYGGFENHAEAPAYIERTSRK